MHHTADLTYSDGRTWPGAQSAHSWREVSEESFAPGDPIRVVGARRMPSVRALARPHSSILSTWSCDRLGFGPSESRACPGALLRRDS